MRIGIDIRPLMEERTTGVQVYVENLLHAVFKLDKENQYILFANAYRPGRLPDFDYPNVETKLFHIPNKLFMLGQVFFGYPKVDKMLGGLDLFFSPHWRATGLSSELPLIVTYHDLSFEVVPSFFTFWRSLWHKIMGYRKVANKADQIVAVSDSTAQDLIRFYDLPPSKIKTIYPGADHLTFPDMKELSNFDKSYFFTLATLEPRKNLQTVIDAYQEYLRRVDEPKRLIIAGSRGWKSDLHIPEGVSDLIEIRSEVSEQEKRDLYRQAFAFIFPSFYEGFGFPLLEAASACLPVVAGANSSQAEIGGQAFLLANPLRPSEFAGAMSQLQTDKELYAKMSNRVQDLSRKYTWEASAKQLIQIFEKDRANSV